MRIMTRNTLYWLSHLVRVLSACGTYSQNTYYFVKSQK